MEDMIARMFVGVLGFVLGLAGYFAVVEYGPISGDSHWRVWVLGLCLSTACGIVTIGSAWLFIHSAMRL